MYNFIAIFANVSYTNKGEFIHYEYFTHFMVNISIAASNCESLNKEVILWRSQM